VDGDDGELQNPLSASDCESAYHPYLSYARYCGPDPDDINRISRCFESIAPLGTDGCSWEQQLKASAKALIDHRDGVNMGFLRPDSVLLIIFLTDEDDCSVALGSEGIFDESDSSLGHMNLRCSNHPDMVEPVETYIEAFESLRRVPDRLALAFIVGVPQGPACEGFGNEISGCLMHPDMQERVDTESSTSLVPSCSSPAGDAYPARRFVQMSQSFGERALVQSICADDFEPLVESIAEWIHRVFNYYTMMPGLPTVKDEEDPCRCLADCRFIESLSDLRSCDTEGKPCFRPDGSGTPCADPEEDPDGLLHTLCEIPQAGTRMSPCDSSLPPEDIPECFSPDVTHSVDGEGWYYMDRNWEETGTGIVNPEPQILFTDGMDPAEGSNVYLNCGYICPENRQCGPEDDMDAVCCEFDEYCLRGPSAPAACDGEPQCCQLRPD